MKMFISLDPLILFQIIHPHPLPVIYRPEIPDYAGHMGRVTCGGLWFSVPCGGGDGDRVGRASIPPNFSPQD